jgi:hypothetical protein
LTWIQTHARNSKINHFFFLKRTTFYPISLLVSEIQSVTDWWMYYEL